MVFLFLHVICKFGYGFQPLLWLCQSLLVMNNGNIGVLKLFWVLIVLNCVIVYTFCKFLAKKLGRNFKEMVMPKHCTIDMMLGE